MKTMLIASVLAAALITPVLAAEESQINAAGLSLSEPVTASFLRAGLIQNQGVCRNDADTDQIMASFERAGLMSSVSGKPAAVTDFGQHYAELVRDSFEKAGLIRPHRASERLASAC